MEDSIKETVNQNNNEAEATTATIENVENLSVEQLQKLLSDEQKKSAEYMESWQRSRADFANLKRRTDNEKSSLSAEAREKLLVRLLPVVDDFERAMLTLPESLKGEAWVNGVSLIEKKLKTFLDQEGVSEVPSLNANFDPRYHEAVQQDDSSNGDTEYVAEVYQKGYKLGDRVIRAAAVKVGHR